MARMPTGCAPVWLGPRSHCADWWRNWRCAGSRSTTTRCGILPKLRASASEKTTLASEQDRQDFAHKRLRWQAHQGVVDLQRFVFIDETWAKSKMAPLRGWAARGKRLIGHAPFWHPNTMTFITALRHDAFTAPWVIDVPINGGIFNTYV